MKTNKFQLVEMIVPANTVNRASFPDQPQLKGKSINAIESFSIQAIPVSPSGVASIAIADFKKSFLVLVEKGSNKVVQLPLVAINRVKPDTTTAANFVPAVAELAELEGLRDIDWTTSYVQFGSAPAAGQFSILLGVHYKD